MSYMIYVLNGPNLNLLGKREPHIYGSATLADVERTCREVLPEGFDLRQMQSNHEGQIIDWVHDARDAAQAIIINPGALTHTSIALLDALKSFEGPVFEVHISNVHQRESFRHHSYVSLRATGVIAGFGIDGYVAATRRACALLQAGSAT